MSERLLEAAQHHVQAARRERHALPGRDDQLLCIRMRDCPSTVDVS